MVYSKKQWNIAEKQTVKFGTVYSDLTFREFRKLYKSQHPIDYTLTCSFVADE